MVLLLQNNSLWSKDIMADGKKGTYTLGEHGCVITSVCNIINMHKKLKADSKPCNPRDLNKLVKENKGYTEDGLVIWAVLEKIIGAKIEPYFYLINERGKDNHYGNVNFQQENVYYIARLNTDTGYHFLNMLGVCSGNYLLFDVYDDRFLFVPSYEIKRIIKITF